MCIKWFDCVVRVIYTSQNEVFLLCLFFILIDPESANIWNEMWINEDVDEVYKNTDDHKTTQNEFIFP